MDCLRERVCGFSAEIGEGERGAAESGFGAGIEGRVEFEGIGGWEERYFGPELGVGEDYGCGEAEEELDCYFVEFWDDGSAERLVDSSLGACKTGRGEMLTLLCGPGVMLSHYNLVAEMFIMSISGRAWAEKEILAGRELAPYRTLAHLPISHIAGLFGYLIAPFYSAGLVVWMRRYNWADLLKYAKQYKITAFYTVPSIYLRISKSKEVTDHFAFVEGASTGAAPMDGVLQASANRKLGASTQGEEEVRIGQTWGLSETTGAVTMMPRGDSDVTGSISPLLPCVEMR